MALLLGLSLVAAIQIGNINAAKYSCFDEGNGNMHMQFTHNDSPDIAQLVGIGNVGQGGTCVSSLDGTNHVLDIVVDTSRVQVSPDPSTSPCFIDTLLVSSPTTLVTFLIAGMTSTALLASDQIFEFTCDFTTLGQGEQTLGERTIGPVGVVYDITERVTPSAADGVTFSATSADGTVTTTASLQEPIRLKLTLDRPADNTALGIYVDELQVSINQDMSAPVETIITGGCTTKTAGEAFYLATNFRSTDTPNPLIATFPLYTSTTGDMTLGRFLRNAATATQNLFFKVSYTIECFDLNDASRCFDQGSLCTGRKRRSVIEGSNTTITTMLLVAPPGYSSTSSLGGKASDDLATQCVIAYNFWIIALVLGILLLLVIFLAIFLFYKIRKAQYKNDTYLDKGTQGVQNSAYRN